MDKDLNKFCRTCLVQNVDLISIYDDDENIKSVCVDLLETLTKRMPFIYDGLPKQVCLSCFQEIKHINFFKLQCINSDNVLRKIVGKRNTDNLVVPNDNTKKEHSTPSRTGNIEIKSEEPCCSYAGNIDNETNKMGIPKTIESQGQVFEVIVKEEPDLHEPKLEVESLEELEESNFCERLDQNCEAEEEDDDSQEENAHADAEYTTKKHLDDSKQNNRNLLQCQNCNKVFKHLERLKKHLMNHKFCKGNFIFHCTLCDKQFNRQYSLQRHLLISHKQKMTKEILIQSTETKTLQNDKGENKIEEELKTLRQCNRCKEV